MRMNAPLLLRHLLMSLQRHVTKRRSCSTKAFGARYQLEMCRCCSGMERRTTVSAPDLGKTAPSREDHKVPIDNALALAQRAQVAVDSSSCDCLKDVGVPNFLMAIPDGGHVPISQGARASEQEPGGQDWTRHCPTFRGGSILLLVLA